MDVVEFALGVSGICCLDGCVVKSLGLQGKLETLTLTDLPRVDRYVHFSGPIFVCEID